MVAHGLKKKRNEHLEDLLASPQRVCDECNTPFAAPKGFESMCPVCFKLDRGYDLYVGDKALLLLQEQYHTQVLRLANLTARYNHLRAKQAPSPSPQMPLDPKRVEQLIRLCHPDKHQNSRAATEMTQWLLSQRRK